VTHIHINVTHIQTCNFIYIDISAFKSHVVF
jgi:hypothetical protein